MGFCGYSNYRLTVDWICLFSGDWESRSGAPAHVIAAGFLFYTAGFNFPKYFGEIGIWISFPIADVLSTILTVYFLNREIRLKLKPSEG